MVIFDTGPIVAAAITKDAAYHACNELLTGLRLAKRRLLLPATVSAEVGYLLNHYGDARVEARFLQGVADGDFEPIDLIPEDYARISELVGTYADLPLGTTEASVIALSERLGVSEFATLDRRHFTVVRPRHTDALTLLPERF